MRKIELECIEFVDHCGYASFGDHLWSDAKEKWDEAEDSVREEVWERVKEWSDALDDKPSMTQINDIVRFECDDLFSPPTFRVEVWTLNDDCERVYMIASERFEGLDAESELEDWVFDRFNHVDYENVLRVIKINESSGYEEDL